MITNDMFCPISGNLFDALCAINKNGKGIAFVVNAEYQLEGIITDGDVRNLLLNGKSLQDKLEDNINRSYVSAGESDSYSDVLNNFNAVIKIIPVLDHNKKVVNYYEFNKSIHIPIAQPHLTGNELNYLLDAFISTWISSNGKYITDFENLFSNYCGANYGVAVSNGTVALELALETLEIGCGDEVIVPDLTFAATINAVLHVGATPVIVDIDPESWCMDPEEVKKAISMKTKAIIPVHLYGQPCDMESITRIAHKHNICIIEDCAEAHGAEFKEKKVGSFGDIGCFSFFGNKVITTGEGGMCITSSKKLYDKMRLLRDHGMSTKHKYFHEIVGHNFRMTNLQAAIGVAQIESIDECLLWRKKLEDKYFEKLHNLNNIILQSNHLLYRKKIAWLVSILVTDGKRDDYIEKLKNIGIDTRPFFIPLSKMNLYRQYMFSNKESSRISEMGINLPTTFDIKDSDIEKIADIFYSHEKL